MTKIIDVMKGILVSALYILIFIFLTIVLDRNFFDNLLGLSVDVMLGLLLVISYYFVEKYMCRKNKNNILFSSGFFLFSTVAMLLILFNFSNGQFDVLYDNYYSWDNSFLAGLQYAIYYLVLCCAFVMTFIVRILIQLGKWVKQKKNKGIDTKYFEY